MVMPTVNRDFAQMFFGAACSANRRATEWISYAELVLTYTGDDDHICPVLWTG